ncbi:hypothetical protein B9Z19DRAFT_1064275 [Tuber borchii]|uniref:Uncharacterized protein n=1 Tax=Tuber borchii TaxID=42251 RepID=A0A2T6ZV58_TUBBO|nr:hypothetical protein B9Z19DRAFT_1064275 [Tuber borchii]
MTEADKLNGPVDATEPLRKVTHGEPVINSSIEGESDRLHGEINRSHQPTARPSPLNSPPLLAHNLSHDLASVAFEQLEVRTSAEHLLMLVSGTQQPADDAVVNTIVADTADVLMDMPVVDVRQESGPVAIPLASSSGYSTPGQLQFQIPSFSSAMLASGSTTLSVEMDVGSSLWFISVLAH